MYENIFQKNFVMSQKVSTFATALTEKQGS
jgi:hypothetical protein